MHFKLWLVESNEKAKNQLATLVQQGVAAGDSNAWKALLNMVKDKDETKLQAIRQIVAGYTKHDGKPGAAAKYLLNTLDDMDHEADQDHYGEKGQQAAGEVRDVLFQHRIPNQLADPLLAAIETQSADPTFFMDRQAVASNRSGKFMTRLMPLLVAVGDHLFSREGEKEAKNAMIDILGTMHHFSDNVPTIQMIMNKIQQAI